MFSMNLLKPSHGLLLSSSPLAGDAMWWHHTETTLGMESQDPDPNSEQLLLSGYRKTLELQFSNLYNRENI